MKCLVVYAHPNPFSFNHAVKNEVVNVLKSKGHEVKITDLYDMEFDPVLKPEDFNLMFNGKVAADIKPEQDKIAWADMIIAVYPIWWTGFPAILKGYFDRTLTYGFAYAFEEGRLVQPLKDKRALLISTHGQPKELYEAGMYQSLINTQDVGVFEFCGIKADQHIFFPAMMQSSEETRKDYLKSLKETLEKL